ncbi:hypothetical protein CDAR_263151 [Caerostris darwini]|uniref:Uncharacterized protein n=1 Tax=Caerostris darwini TaxID=1538125 RepID=A0AAV4RZ21_9ARAC|nr:hypothetical protein CDAR_263151 [Caerostris darwini]
MYNCNLFSCHSGNLIQCEIEEDHRYWVGRYLFWQNIISWHPEYDMLNKKVPHENPIKRSLVPKPDQLNRQSSLGFHHRANIDLRYTHDKVAKVSNYRNNAPLAKSSLDQGIPAKSVSPLRPALITARDRFK